MSDEPQGDGYSVVLDRGKIQVNLVKRWLDDAIRVATKATVAADRWTHVAVTYDGSRVADGVRVYLDGVSAPMTVLLDELNQSFESKQPLRIGAGGGPQARFVGAIDEPSVYDRALGPEAIAILAAPESITKIAALSPGSRTPGQAAKIRKCFLATEAPTAIRRLAVEIDNARAELDAMIDRVPTTMVMQEMPAPRPTHVLIRGQYDQPGPPVGPGVPGAIAPSLQAAKADRLALAQWLINPANPMTARVAVNRDWQMLFGTGLVKTVDDFGAQGEPPSHPELLDWLATEFIRSGWDMKAMLRLMVMSGTYRQSSRVPPEANRRDPDNRLLARAHRLRLSAEMIRDQALHLGGLLVEHAGGPSVKPYQPPGLWNELADADYVQDHGPDLYRRGLYTFWKRTVPPPSMVAFDAPGRETCVVREVRTDTPLQALNVLNDVTYVEAARALAERMLRERETSPRARLAAAFRPPPADGRFPRSWPSCSTDWPIRRPASERPPGRRRTDPRGRIHARPPPRSRRAGGLHHDRATDPQPRRDAQQGVIARGPARRTRPTPDAPPVPRPDLRPGPRRDGAFIAARPRPRGGGQRSRPVSVRRRHRGFPQFRPPGEAGDLPVPVGRAVADGPLRREAPAAPPPGDRAARLDPDGPAADRHDLAAGALPGRGQPIPVRPTRPERGGPQRAAAAHRERRRPPLLHQVDAHRGDQSRPGGDVLPDRGPACGSAQHRRLGGLRPGEREPRPASLRRHDLAGLRQPQRPAAV